MFNKSVRAMGLVIAAFCLSIATLFNAQQPAAAQSLALVWSDEFNGPLGSAPDGNKWKYDLGGGGWGNNELQDYTNSTNNAYIASDGAATDGRVLAIRAIKEVTGRGCWYGTCQYTSARLLTAGKYTVQYGRIEARVKVPIGQGYWPAFWMLGDDIGSVGWPQSGEIDIMEIIGSDVGRAHGTIHGPGYSGGSGRTASYVLPGGGRFSDGYHTFRVDWYRDRIEWYIDGNLYHTRTPADVQGFQWVFNHPFFMIMNLAVGGNWPGSPNGSTVFPQEVRFDYVRVYQQVFQPPTNTPRPQPTNTPVPQPTNPPGGCSAPAYNNSAVYVAGNQVSYNGRLWQAKWWTQYEAPSTGGSGVWQDLGPCSSGGGINPSTWYQVINQNSNKCVDNTDGGTTNGTLVQQWACFAGAINQGWQFRPTSDGYYQVVARRAPSIVWDVSGVSAADNAAIHLWAFVGGGNQQWRAESLGGGYYRFVARHSGKCLDVPAASTADGVKLVQYTCNGTAAQSFRLQAQ